MQTDAALVYEEVTRDAVDGTIQDLTPDEAPQATEFEYSCQHPGCGVELSYGGRGRKPIHCKTHQPLYRQSRGTRGETVTRASAGKWQAPLAQALTNNFVGIGLAVYAFEQFDGQAIISGSPQLATSLVTVAETNPQVRQALTKFVTAGGWAQVAMAVSAIALPILQHHGAIPAIKLPNFQPQPQPQAA